MPSDVMCIEVKKHWSTFTIFFHNLYNSVVHCVCEQPRSIILGDSKPMTGDSYNKEDFPPEAQESIALTSTQVKFDTIAARWATVDFAIGMNGGGGETPVSYCDILLTSLPLCLTTDKACYFACHGVI